ncbi:UNVERIFIED_CONTAM: TonB-dependent receptor, partial [Bacteroidetes bacterium 56_B9]
TGGLHYQTVASDMLTWEVAKKHDLGIDLSLWNGKFTLTADIFKDTREQIYMQRQHLNSLVGITNNPWANVGKMQSTGFDGNFMFRHKLGQVDITLRGNITYTH